MPLRPVANFAEALGEDQVVVSFSIGPAGEAVAFAVAGPDAQKPFPTEEQPGWATFPKPKADHPYSAVILVHDGSTLRRTELREVDTTFPFVQPLPEGEFLVAGARSRRREDDADLNGRVYGRDGNLRREFLLGDGIEDVQTTRDGRIWVSYSDEGVYGNFGWGGPGGPSPIGTSGLVRLDSLGNREWDYVPPPGVGAIDDCYAMNVAEDATWAYYYSEFPLVRIAPDGEIENWDTRFNGGARAFAVGSPNVVFFGGYEDERDRCLLCKFESGRVVEVAPLRLVLPTNVQLNTHHVVGRSSKLHALVDNAWYELDVREL